MGLADDIRNNTYSPQTLADIIEKLAQPNDLITGTSGGTANAHTLSVDASYTAYATGDRFTYFPSVENTGATTFNVNSISAKSIKHNGGFDVVAAQLPTYHPVQLIYDGTDMIYCNPPNNLILNENGTQIISTTSETTVSSLTIPADALAAARGIKILAYGEYLNDVSASESVFLTAHYGSTYIARYTALFNQSSNPRAIWFEAVMHALTTTTQRGAGFCLMSTASSNADDGIMNTDSDYRNTIQESMSEDSTTALTLKFTGQPSTSSASLSFTPRRVTFEML